MTDLEITKLCAEAIGLAVRIDTQAGVFCWDDGVNVQYDPLNDDAQAMTLVKLWPMPTTAAIREGIMTHSGRWETFDLNRAICECVAKMQAAKVAA